MTSSLKLTVVVGAVVACAVGAVVYWLTMSEVDVDDGVVAIGVERPSDVRATSSGGSQVVAPEAPAGLTAPTPDEVPDEETSSVIGRCLAEGRPLEGVRVRVAFGSSGGAGEPAERDALSGSDGRFEISFAHAEVTEHRDVARWRRSQPPW